MIRTKKLSGSQISDSPSSAPARMSRPFVSEAPAAQTNAPAPLARSSAVAGHSLSKISIFPVTPSASPRVKSPDADAENESVEVVPVTLKDGEARVSRVPDGTGTASAPPPLPPRPPADGPPPMPPRDHAPSSPDMAPASPTHTPPTSAQLAEVKTFLQHGTYGPQALVPPTNLGGFDAAYHPNTKRLQIAVNAGAEFLNGLSLTGGIIVANHTDLTQAAADGNNLPANKRAAFVAQFTWSAAQKTAFLLQLKSKVQMAWSGQHTFQCVRPGWNSVRAGVNIVVGAHQGPSAPTDHLHISAYKVPESGTYNVGAFVDGHNDQNPHNNDMTVSSAHVKPTPLSNSLLRRQVMFANNSAALDAGANTILSGFIADFRTTNVPMSNPVQVVSHVPAKGSTAATQTLAKQRADAVQAYLGANGFNGVTQRVHTSTQAGAISSRRVDLIVGSGEGQFVAAHEFGHVFGLRDEYSINPGGTISGTGLPVGAITGHDAMAKAVGAPGAIAENNDNIMSLGNTIRPQHYATFGWALQQVTGVNEWQVS